MVNIQNNLNSKQVTLIILDGFGLALENAENAIASASKPNFNSYLDNYPSFSLAASGESVGLFGGQAGNSLVGHLTLGTGREVFSPLLKIRRAIADGSFFTNPVLLAACEFVREHKSALHLAGLVSDADDVLSGDHYLALLEFAKQQNIKKVFFHVFLNAGSRRHLEQLEKKMTVGSLGQIASVTGIDFAYDLTGAWQKTEKIYSVMTSAAKNKRYDNLEQMFNDAENKQLNLNALPPALINVHGSRTGRVKTGDSLVFFDCVNGFPAQLLKSFVLPSFIKFKRASYLRDIFVASLVSRNYNDLPIAIAWPETEIINSLSQVISDSGLAQLKVAETVKYVYVTHFFNAGKKNCFPNEEWLLVPAGGESVKDDPEMSAGKIATAVVKNLEENDFAFICVNLANSDEAAHTGDFNVTVKAVEAVDKALGKIVEKVLLKNGVAVITADHGNAERISAVISENRRHTSSPVPLLIVGKDFAGKVAKNSGNVSDLINAELAGGLADVAPTILKILGLKRPEEMTGKPLI